jgi:hypothetical protein
LLYITFLKVLVAISTSTVLAELLSLYNLEVLGGGFEGMIAVVAQTIATELIFADGSKWTYGLLVLHSKLSEEKRSLPSINPSQPLHTQSLQALRPSLVFLALFDGVNGSPQASQSLS